MGEYSVWGRGVVGSSPTVPTTFQTVSWVCWLASLIVSQVERVQFSYDTPILFQGGIMVVLAAVNRVGAGSSPAPGATLFGVLNRIRVNNVLSSGDAIIVYVDSELLNTVDDG